jgi:adenosylcobinamide-GDP ribazoletransferase
MRSLRAAFGFLTILPVGGQPLEQPGRAFAWFPLVGLFIGTFLVLIAQFAPPTLAPFLIVVAWVVMTGGLHLDGFGDSCDGLFATTTPERRLEIMKDPRTGTWAVVGLVVLLIGKVSLVSQVAPLLLVVVPVVGRYAMVSAALFYPYARPTGLGAYFRNGLTAREGWIATFLAIVVVLLIATQNHRALPTLIVAPVVVLLVGRWTARRLGGGLTGDVYGFICELTELLCLVGLVWVS